MKANGAPNRGIARDPLLECLAEKKQRRGSCWVSGRKDP